MTYEPLKTARLEPTNCSGVGWLSDVHAVGAETRCLLLSLRKHQLLTQRISLLLKALRGNICAIVDLRLAPTAVAARTLDVGRSVTNRQWSVKSSGQSRGFCAQRFVSLEFLRYLSAAAHCSKHTHSHSSSVNLKFFGSLIFYSTFVITTATTARATRRGVAAPTKLRLCRARDSRSQRRAPRANGVR